MAHRWDVFAWLGFRRFARHWSIPQLQAELRDSYRIPLSDDAIAGYLQGCDLFAAPESWVFPQVSAHVWP